MGLVYDSVAQLVEQLPFKQWVESSSLFRVTNLIKKEILYDFI